MNFSTTLICSFSSRTTFFNYFMYTISFAISFDILVVFASINVSMTIVMLRSLWKTKMLILIECMKISKIFSCILISTSYNLIHWECWQKNITFFFLRTKNLMFSLRKCWKIKTRFFELFEASISRISFFMWSMIVFIFATIWMIVLLFRRFMTFLLQCLITTLRFFAKTFIIDSLSFWLAESNLKIDKKKMIFVRSRCMKLISLNTRWRSKIFDWTWFLMIKLFKQSKIFKTRVLRIVFWLLFKFRRSCRTWSRRWIQCSFENKVNVIVTSSVNQIREDILDIKKWKERILKRWFNLKTCVNYNLNDYFKSWD
jgi:hypothetical protein